MNLDPRLPRPNESAFYVRLHELFRETRLTLNGKLNTADYPALTTVVANKVLGSTLNTIGWEDRTRTLVNASPGSLPTADFDSYEAFEYTFSDDATITLSGGVVGQTYSIAVHFTAPKTLTLAGGTRLWAGGSPVTIFSGWARLRILKTSANYLIDASAYA